MAAVLWLSQQAGPLLTDPKYRQRKLEDVREKVGAAWVLMGSLQPPVQPCRASLAPTFLSDPVCIRPRVLCALTPLQSLLPLP